MNVAEGIVTSLKREKEPDRVYSFVQGIMPAFERAFDEKYGDTLDDDEIIILPGKDIVLHKKLGFDSSWYGSPSPPVQFGEKHGKLLQQFNEKYHGINPNYFVNASGGLYNRGEISGHPHNFQMDGLLKTEETWEDWYEGYTVGEIPDSAVDQVNEAYRMGLENDFLIIPSTGLLMEPLIGSIGIDSFAKYARSNFLEKICNTLMIVPYKKMDFLCKTDVPVIIIPDDCAYKGRPIMSPRMYKKFIIPHFGGMIKKAHAKGKLVIFHSDGYVEPYYDALVEVGLDAHESLEPVAGNDLKEIKEKYKGRLSLIGNIDSSRLLPFGTKEDVIEETKKCLRDGAPGGGYMFSPCTDLTDSCKLENAEVMMETYKKYRNYPINVP